jgi:peptidoglycan/xylan/chitin deacetylase (PgdA/CDA1 family)
MIILTGLVILTAAVLIFLFIIKGVYGNYNISEILPTRENLSLLSSDGESSAAILYSKYTENLLPQGSTWLNDNINTWKNFLRSSKIRGEVISDQAIELGEHFKYKLLILPGAKSLSDREIAQIKRFIEKGGSVFATSGTASFSDNGKWRGWDFFSEVFGLKFTKEIMPDEFTKIHTLRGGLPLTAGIPTGYPLKIATWDRPMACEILDPRTTQVSFWYNFRTELGLVREEVSKSAGIAYGSYGNGRFIWMGFELNSVIGQQEDYINFGRLFQNSINWLTYSPTAFVRDWPGTHESAAVFMPVIGANAYNVQNLFGIISSEKTPMTFFVDPASAEENRDILKNIHYYGELSPIVDLGYLTSINDTINKLYDFNTQLNHFNQSKLGLSRLPGRPGKGAIPLYGLYDDNSVHALINAGYNYIITDSLTDRSVPKTIIKGDKRIIAFTKTARDDYEVIRNYGLTDREFQLYTYEEDIDRLLFEGGLYIFKMHTDYQCQPQYVDVVRELIRYLRQKNIWITTISEVRDWWLSKSNLEVNAEVRSSRRIAVEVSNPGNFQVNDVVVQVNLNRDIHNLQLSSDIFGTRIPKYSFDRKNQILRLKIDRIDAGEAFSYFVDFDSPAI